MEQKKITKTKIAIFEGKKIRRHWDGKAEKWFFSVVDIVAALTDSVNLRDYWFKMKIRVKTEEGAELSPFCRQLKLPASDGKFYLTDTANTEGIFRIIQSIPSPKAEPFKLWLARVGFDTPITRIKRAGKRIIVMSTRGHVAGELLDLAKYIDLRKLKNEISQ